jgi:hypothetical protein
MRNVRNWQPIWMKGTQKIFVLFCSFSVSWTYFKIKSKKKKKLSNFTCRNLLQQSQQVPNINQWWFLVFSCSAWWTNGTHRPERKGVWEKNMMSSASDTFHQNANVTSKKICLVETFLGFLKEGILVSGNLKNLFVTDILSTWWCF